ncbi:HAMP domain-containing protein (plasmid) [Paroceanicella profunda]|uniref:HAMP domain-containing protein n=1 Tax=Paroceanicella profunda TaxID=2579971 RepID=A0A5B8FJV0_9RHOB|nr:methyl-accepting chemotaxis protein [Paroceanicella profunda]QDL94748.1 HAMP domain-containing protein [Paroceanicella profunda]
MRTQLTIMVTGLCLVIALAVGGMSYFSARDAALARSEAALKARAVREAAAVAEYLSGARYDLEYLAGSVRAGGGVAALRTGWETADPAAMRRLYLEGNPNPVGSRQKLDDAGDGSAYSAAHALWHPTLRAFQQNRGYYDLFLIGPAGRVLYTVFKEADFGDDLSRAPLSSSGLGEVYARVRDAGPGGGVAFSDFRPYAPSAGVPASFMALGIWGDSGALEGVIAAQIPSDRIEALLKAEDDPDTGRYSFLIGADGLLRSDTDLTTQDDILSTRFDTSTLEGDIDVVPGLAGTLSHVAIAPVQPVPGFGSGGGWRLVSQVPEEVFLGPVRQLGMRILAISALLVLVAAVLGFLLARSFTRPILGITQAVKVLAEGKTTDVPGSGRSDEIGDLSRSLFAIHEASAEAKRVGAAVESSSALFLLADENRQIVYLNGALKQTLESSRPFFEKQIPGWDGSFIGRYLDTFGRGGVLERRNLEVMDHPISSELSFDDRMFEMILAPVLLDDGTLLGYVTQWTERTRQRQAEQQIAAMIAAIGSGDFSRRVEIQGQDGFIREAAQGVNRIGELVSGFLGELDTVLSALAEGDMTGRMDMSRGGQYQRLAEVTNRSISTLSDLVVRISAAQGRMTSTSQAILTGATDLAKRAEEQAASLEETAATMEEMTANVRASAENATKVTGLARDAAGRASEGQEVVSNAVSAMVKIEESSGKISDITAVIDSIAFQTNLLALNAAVEAARAGDAGKGFAVVASEVRTLAQRSSQAARDIKDLIQDSSAHVTRGVDLVKGTGTALTGIVESITRVAGTIEEISNASREQSSGIEEISSVVSSMDERTQANAQVAEESAGSARQISEVAGELGTLIGVFRTGKTAATATVSGPARRPASAPASTGGEQHQDAEWERLAQARRARPTASSTSPSASPAKPPAARAAAKPAKPAAAARPAAKPPAPLPRAPQAPAARPRVAAPAAPAASQRDDDWSEF